VPLASLYGGFVAEDFTSLLHKRSFDCGRFCEKRRRFAVVSIREKMFLDLTSGEF
jgi:hypothetical protein